MDAPNQATIDDDLIYFFKNFKEILAQPRKYDTESVSAKVDLRVFAEYLIDDVRGMQQRLDTEDEEYLRYVCEHIYSINEWMRLIMENRTEAGETFSGAIGAVFEQHFGDKRILHSIYNSSLERWIVGRAGQHSLGGNVYTILAGKLYYRNRFGEWFDVDKATAFDLQPSMSPIQDIALTSELDDGYQGTWYDAAITSWGSRGYQGVLPDDFLWFDKQVTSPEEYFEFTTAHINWLLNNPVSITELERWYGGVIDNLEDTIKLGVMVLNIVKDRRADDSHTIYLLRDCLVFYEIHKTLDLLNSEETHSDQLMIGRKLLSDTPDQWGYYIVMLDALYESHIRYPNDFDKFYGEFARFLDLFVHSNPSFKALVGDLATYIERHLRPDRANTVIFDVGFQGSINLLVKYIIDYHINPSSKEGKVKVDIEVSVGALWSKSLFGHRAKGYYFPFLNRMQRMARSDELYHYKFGSLNAGGVQVIMGNKERQKKAAVELVVLVMITQLGQTGF